MKDLEHLFKVLGSEKRLRILNLLFKHKQLSVMEIMKKLNWSQSTVSIHLSILKKAGFVKDNRKGQHIFYQVNLRKDRTYQLRLLLLLKEWFKFTKSGSPE